MKIDFSHHLTTLDGAPIVTDSESKHPCTLAFATVEALLGTYPGEQQSMTGTRTIERYTLAQRIYGATDALDVTAEQISEIKRLLALRWPPLIGGQACLLLEGQGLNAA